MATTAPILELRDVTKSFGGTTALHGVSMAVEPGGILCLLGDNGAGRSTLIKMLIGYHQPTARLGVWVGGCSPNPCSPSPSP